MRYTKVYDSLLNVFLPLLAGVFIYWADGRLKIPTVIRYHLPDGVWAYAFTSCMLIVWERKVHWPWISGVMIISVVYELLQHYHVIPGIGDIEDVMTYFLFFSIALLSNAFFKALMYTRNYAKT
jgi:hypothetical protein